MLVGIGAGYALVVATRGVLIPVLRNILSTTEEPGNIAWIVPLIFALFLLLKAIPRLAWLGSGSMAVLVGIGASVSFVGAVVGTLWPQITSGYGQGLLSLVVALLAVSAVAYFWFTGRQNSDGKTILPFWYRYVAVTGRAVITVTLASLFAGLLSTSLVVLSQRIGFFVESFGEIFSGLAP